MLSTECVTDLDKLYSVRLVYGGLVLSFGQFLQLSQK